MSPDVYARAGLFYCWTDTDKAGQLLGIVEVGKAPGGYNQRCGKCDPDTLY